MYFLTVQSTFYNGGNPSHVIAAAAIAVGSYSALRAMKGDYDGGEEGKKACHKHTHIASLAAIWAFDGFSSIPQVDQVLKSGLVGSVAAKIGVAVTTKVLLDGIGYVVNTIASKRPSSIKKETETYTKHM